MSDNRIPDYLHAEIGPKGRRQAVEFEEDYTPDALAWCLVAALECIAKAEAEIAAKDGEIERMKADLATQAENITAKMVYVEYHKQLAAKDEQIQRLMKPVTDEEMQSHFFTIQANREPVTSRPRVDALLSSRAREGQ